MQQPFGLSSSALGAVVRVSLDGGDLAVGFRHEGLQLFFKKLICGLGRGRGDRGRTGRAGSTLLRAAVVAEIAPGRAVLPLGSGFQTLDGQVDLAAFGADDHDLYILTLCQVLTDIADIGVGHLRDMYHAGLVLGQGDKCAEIGDRFDFSF